MSEDYTKEDCINDVCRAELCAEVTIPGERWRVILQKLCAHFGVLRCPTCGVIVEDVDQGDPGCEDPLCEARSAH